MPKGKKVKKNRKDPVAGYGDDHLIRVPSQSWADWDSASMIAGVSRNTFIITVVNHAARQILDGARPKKSHPYDPSTGRYVERKPPPPPPPAPEPDHPVIEYITITGQHRLLEVRPPGEPGTPPTVVVPRAVYLDMHYCEPGSNTTGRSWDKENCRWVFYNAGNPYIMNITKDDES